MNLIMFCYTYCFLATEPQQTVNSYCAINIYIYIIYIEREREILFVDYTLNIQSGLLFWRTMILRHLRDFYTHRMIFACARKTKLQSGSTCNVCLAMYQISSSGHVRAISHVRARSWRECNQWCCPQHQGVSSRRARTSFVNIYGLSTHTKCTRQGDPACANC